MPPRQDNFSCSHAGHDGCHGRGLHSKPGHQLHRLPPDTRRVPNRPHLPWSPPGTIPPRALPLARTTTNVLPRPIISKISRVPPSHGHV